MSAINIGVLVSGGGTNLQAIIDHINSGNINGKIQVVISNKKTAYGLTRASDAGIEAMYIDPHDFASDEDFNLKLIKEFKDRGVELIVLAGFLKVLSKNFIAAYTGKIMNIHPSLIPSFCGKNYYGSKVHEEVLKYGVKYTGATVHFVDEGTDTGPIILQGIVPVEPDDTVESLQGKVLVVEHEILVKAVKLYCENRISLEGRKVIIDRGDFMKRALISVYDKEGIVDFSRELRSLGWEIISTGGTYKALKEAGIEVLDVEEVTGFPEILEGRVKTLHPLIHGGLLFKRDDQEHVEVVAKMNIGSIDIVVNNLYPFEETIKKKNVSHEEIIENIDIGGPSMIRAAAKNYKFVSVLVDPKDYDKVLDELKTSGNTSIETRQYLASKVFTYTAYYDSLIAKYFNELEKVDFPELLTLAYKKQQELRYGENPHQSAAFYREVGEIKGTIAGSKQLHGKELSFNNINDSNGALDILKEFQEPTVVAVKHANPCGIGSGKDILEAYSKAYECDNQSIFGGIIASNREIGADVAKKINEIFIEVILAPSYTSEAVEILTTKKNIRLIEISDIDFDEYKEFDMKKVTGGLLLQQRDDVLLLDDMKVVTHRFPTEDELEDLSFAWKAVKRIKSNGVVIVKDQATLGFGLGEVNRFWAVENAIKRAKEKAVGSSLASDGFFPFKDSIEALAQAGIKSIIQPGGSIKDQEVIDEANKHGIAMVFTGIRHFKH